MTLTSPGNRKISSVVHIPGTRNLEPEILTPAPGTLHGGFGWSRCSMPCLTTRSGFIFVYSSILGDIRLWVGPRIEHLLSSWDLTTGLHPTLSLSAWYKSYRLLRNVRSVDQNAAPYTLHPTPYTLHPTPYTLWSERRLDLAESSLDMVLLRFFFVVTLQPRVE